MPKEYIEVFGNGVSMAMTDFRELVVYKNGKASKEKSANQDKGFVGEFKAFKDAVKSGESAISFESIYNTTKTTFKILESIRTKTLVEVWYNICQYIKGSFYGYREFGRSSFLGA